MNTAFITLGRNGDMLNTLPLLYYTYQLGARPTIITTTPYLSLVDGVSYADAVPYAGYYGDTQGAKAFARRLGFNNVILAQCYGEAFTKERDSFASEAWRLAGFDSLWGKLPLVFDRRDPERERALLERVKSDKPIVLTCFESISSPFPHSAVVLDALRPFRDRFEFVDVSSLRAVRFYDLLALYEKAVGLVTVDTGPLHLAQATPHLPVVALVQDKPSSWFGSPPRSNHVLRVPYAEVGRRAGEIAQIVDTIEQRKVQRIIHVWSDYTGRKADAMHRHEMAKETWRLCGATLVDCRVADEQLRRSSRKTLGDTRACPFVKDLIESGAKVANDDDILLFTNDDTCLADGAVECIRSIVNQRGALWCARRELPPFVEPLPSEKMMKGYKHVGADLFAFTKGWWTAHCGSMPDMLYGYEAFDLVLKKLILLRGGVEAENLCYHEIHVGLWTKNRIGPGARHNQKLAFDWFKANNLKWT